MSKAKSPLRPAPNKIVAKHTRLERQQLETALVDLMQRTGAQPRRKPRPEYTPSELRVAWLNWQRLLPKKTRRQVTSFLLSALANQSCINKLTATLKTAPSANRGILKAELRWRQLLQPLLKHTEIELDQTRIKLLEATMDRYSDLHASTRRHSVQINLRRIHQLRRDLAKLSKRTKATPILLEHSITLPDPAPFNWAYHYYPKQFLRPHAIAHLVSTSGKPLCGTTATLNHTIPDSAKLITCPLCNDRKIS